MERRQKSGFGSRSTEWHRMAQTGWALKYASNELKRNKEVVMAAVARDVRALQFASCELKED